MNADVPSLMNLVLRSNNIVEISTRAFHKLEFLQKLDLSHNKIKTISAGAFEGLEKLQRIYLHANFITKMDVAVLPPSLHGITIHENRFVRSFVRSFGKLAKCKSNPCLP